jgi:hypothetical protein
MILESLAESLSPTAQLFQRHLLDIHYDSIFVKRLINAFYPFISYRFIYEKINFEYP